MGYAHVIATHPVLNRLSPEQVDLLCRSSRERSYSRHQVIAREGFSNAELHLVIDGYIKLTKTASDGRELIVGVAGPDDLFGLCCQPVWPGTARCSARAQTRAKVITIVGQAWSTLMAQSPETAHVVLHALMVSRNHCVGLSSDLAFLKLEGRLAKLLLGLSRWSRADAAGVVPVPRLFSQTELASAVGSTRVAVTRKLRSLVEAGALSRDGRAIFISDVPKLKSYFEPQS